MVATGQDADAVHCALYDIDLPEQALLDRFEGSGYRRDVLRIGGFGEVFCYLALSDFIDEELRPYSWYRDLVFEGARYHGFPSPYLDRLCGMECLADPVVERHEKNLSVLSNGRSSGAGG